MDREEEREEEMDMEEKLNASAIEGNAELLKQLLQEDPLILEKTTLKCPNKTPLHISAIFGHLEFVRAILNVSEMCFARDGDGRNPLHIAAIKGKGEVLKVLIQFRPLAAREMTDGGGTILHLCVKYNQLEALKIVLEVIKDLDFINAKNDEGLTILHLAVLDQQVETVRCLVDNNIDVNKKNANDKTALDLSDSNENSEIAKILHESSAMKSLEMSNTGWLDKKRDAIMIVATLIATLAFQAGLNPAGGVWQDDFFPANNSQGTMPPPRSHRAGEAIMAYYRPKYFRYFVRSNTIAFVSSLSKILLLISGLPFKRRLFMWFLMVIMWITITSVALTYGISIMMITPKYHKKTLSHVIETAVTVWCFVMSLLLLGNTLRLIKKWINTGGLEKFGSRFGNRGLRDQNTRTLSYV